MLPLLRRAASRLPRHWQVVLRWWWWTWRLRLGLFRYDEPEYETLSQWVSEGDWVIDVGANLGLYTARLSKLVGPEGRVLAFEPMPETFSLLAFHSRLFAYPNVTLLNAAASDTFGLIGMETPVNARGLPNIYRAHVVDAPAASKVFSLPVDALCIPARVSFIKIDVEGHERRVLQGMENLLKKHSPVLLVEGSSPEVAEFLQALGYAGARNARSPNMLFRRQT